MGHAVDRKKGGIPISRQEITKCNQMAKIGMSPFSRRSEGDVSGGLPAWAHGRACPKVCRFHPAA
jgi:hypothetical protein